MARGWESKAVEAQQAEAIESSPAPKARLTLGEKLTLQKKEGLLLDRRRVAQQLEITENPHYRAMLEQALRDLDQKISALG